MCIGKGRGAEIADLGIAALGAGLGFGAMGVGPLAGMFSGTTAPAGGLGAAGAALAGNALPESEAVGISGAPAALGAHALGNPGLLSSLSNFGHGLATAQKGIGAAQAGMNMLGLGAQPQAPPGPAMRPPAGPAPMPASQILQASPQIGVPPGGAASMVGNRMGMGAPGMGTIDPRLLALLMQQRGMA